MRLELLDAFVSEVRIELKPILEKLDFSYLGEIDERFLDKSCLFQSQTSTIRLIVAMVSEYLSPITVLLKKTEKKFIFGRRERKLNLADFAEAMGYESPEGNPIKGPDDLKREIDRLKGWIQKYGNDLASVDAALWRRGEETGKIRLRRWEEFSRDPEKAQLYHQQRREAVAAKERGDVTAFVKAYESIEKWLGLAEREELERARETIVEL